MKLRIILLTVLSLFSLNASAAFTFKANHPSSQPITQLTGFNGGVYAGHDSSGTFPIYRFEPTTNQHVLEHTLNAGKAERVRTLSNRLVVLGNQPNGDVMSVRDVNGNWTTLLEADVNNYYFYPTLSNFKDVSVAATSPSPAFNIIANDLVHNQAMVDLVYRLGQPLSIGNGSYGGGIYGCTIVKSPYIRGFYDHSLLTVDVTDQTCSPIYQYGQFTIPPLNFPGAYYSTFAATTSPIVESVTAQKWAFTQQGDYLYKHQFSIDYAQPVLTYPFPIYDVIEYRQRVVVLRTDGNVCYSTNTQQWNCFDQAPSSARQLAIEGNSIYVGTNTSEIWSAPNPLINLPALQTLIRVP